MIYTQALTIIRQKPEGVSSREYTEKLALQFSQLQADWRERALQLQQELLRTRQELTRFQIQAETLDLTHHPHTAGGRPVNIVIVYSYVHVCELQHLFRW